MTKSYFGIDILLKHFAGNVSQAQTLKLGGVISIK